MAEKVNKQKVYRKRRGKSLQSNENKRLPRKSKLEELLRQLAHRSSSDDDNSQPISVSTTSQPISVSTISQPPKRRRTRPAGRSQLSQTSSQSSKHNTQTASLTSEASIGTVSKETTFDHTHSDDTLPIATKKTITTISSKSSKSSSQHKGHVLTSREKQLATKASAAGCMATTCRDYKLASKVLTKPIKTANKKTFFNNTSRLSVKLRGMFRDGKEGEIVKRRDPLGPVESSDSVTSPLRPSSAEYKPGRKSSHILNVLFNSGDGKYRTDQSGSSAEFRTTDPGFSRYRTPTCPSQAQPPTPAGSGGSHSDVKTPADARLVKYTPCTTPEDMGTVQNKFQLSLRQIPQMSTLGYFDTIMTRVRKLGLHSERIDRTPERQPSGSLRSGVATRRNLMSDYPNAASVSANQHLPVSDSPPINVFRQAENQSPMRTSPAIETMKSLDDSRDFVMRPVLCADDEVENKDPLQHLQTGPFSEPSSQSGIGWFENEKAPPTRGLTPPITHELPIEPDRLMLRDEELTRLYSGAAVPRYRPAYDRYQAELKVEDSLDLLDHIRHPPCQCDKCLFSAPLQPPYAVTKHASLSPSNRSFSDYTAPEPVFSSLSAQHDIHNPRHHYEELLTSAFKRKQHSEIQHSYHSNAPRDDDYHHSNAPRDDDHHHSNYQFQRPRDDNILREIHQPQLDLNFKSYPKSRTTGKQELLSREVFEPMPPPFYEQRNLNLVSQPEFHPTRMRRSHHSAMYDSRGDISYSRTDRRQHSPLVHKTTFHNWGMNG